MIIALRHCRLKKSIISDITERRPIRENDTSGAASLTSVAPGRASRRGCRFELNKKEKEIREKRSQEKRNDKIEKEQKQLRPKEKKEQNQENLHRKGGRENKKNLPGQGSSEQE